MNIAIFKEAQEAYERGEYAAALVGFTACSRQVGELSQAETCKFYHLIGNCYIKSGMAAKAAEFYNKALEIASPERKPSLLVNLGTAYLTMEDANQALHAFKQALNWPGYATPYKALSGIGAVELKAGHMEAAGNAYRAAALDPANPAPAKSLVNLGVCFMELGRSEDAVVSYETALDLGLSAAGTNKCKANLAQAYLAQGRVSDALAAFEEATADGTYQLSKVAAHDMTMARSLKERFGDYLGLAAEDEPVASEQDVQPEEAPAADPSATVALEPVQAPDADAAEESTPEPEEDLFAGIESQTEPVELDSSAAETQVFPVVSEAASAVANEPVLADSVLQPAEQHDEESTLIPSPEDTAFFSVSEEQIDKQAKEERRKARKGRVGLKVALVIVVLLLIVAAAGVALYMKGYGYPLQETVAQEFLQAATNDQSTDIYWDGSVAQESRDSQMAVLEDVTNTQVIAVERNIASSTVYASGVLKDGGTAYFQIAMGRDLISWNVQFVELYFPSAAE